MSMKRAGYTARWRARAIATRPPPAAGAAHRASRARTPRAHRGTARRCARVRPRRPSPLRAADQPGRRDRVVRRAKRPARVQAPLVGAPQRLWMRVTSIASRAAQRRQDRGQSPREHRLAGSRRTAQQAVVPARRGDHERSHRMVLTAHVAQVRLARRAPPRWRRSATGRSRQRIRAAAGEDAHRARERLNDDHLESLDQHRLAGARARRARVHQGRAPRRLRDRQRPREQP